MSSSLERTEQKLHDCEEQLRLKRVLLEESGNEIELQTTVLAQIGQLKTKRLAYRSKITYLRSNDYQTVMRFDMANQANNAVRGVIIFMAFASICLAILTGTLTYFCMSIMEQQQAALNAKLEKIVSLVAPGVLCSTGTA